MNATAPAAAEFDVFLSHAGEDKAAVARPLTAALRARGISVWLDEDEIQVGDSLHQTLDRGLAAARFGVVVLSPYYFRKAWTQRELGALLALETESGRKQILPVRHQVDQDEVTRFAPTLADRIGVATSEGLDQVAARVAAALAAAASGASAVESPPEPAFDERLLHALPLGLLTAQQEPLMLAEDGGAITCLAVATGDRLLAGRAAAGRLQGRAAEVLAARRRERVDWITHWEDPALCQLSLELRHFERGGRPWLAIENVTGYSARAAAMEVIGPAGRQLLPPGDTCELESEGTISIVLGRGAGERVLRIAGETFDCGGIGIPFYRSEDTHFCSPPGDPAARRVSFYGVWIPLAADELENALRRSRAGCGILLAPGRRLEFFHHPEAGPLVAGDRDLEAALGLG